MKSIEFIGPSGIGKTTFLNNFSKVSNTTDRWISSREVLHQLKSKPYTEKNIFTRFINKINSNRAPEISTLHLKKEKLFKKYNNDIALILKIFIHSMNESDIEAWKKISILDHYLYSVIKPTLLIESSIDERKVVVFDEGIVNNSHISSLDVNELNDYANLTDSRIFPSAVVYFDSENNILKERMNKRFLKRGDRRLYRFGDIIPEDKVDMYINKTRSENLKKAEICKLLGIPVLEINIEARVDHFSRLDTLVSSAYKLDANFSKDVKILTGT